MFKIHHGFSQVSCLDLFHNCNKNKFYSLRSQHDFQIPRTNPTLKGTGSIRYFGPVIWNNTPIEIRSIQNFDTFKTEIRKWEPTNCCCRSCETYVKDLDFTLVNNNAC